MSLNSNAQRRTVSSRTPSGGGGEWLGVPLAVRDGPRGKGRRQDRRRHHHGRRQGHARIRRCDQTIVVQHSVLSAVPASFDFTGNMFAITADRMAHCRGREAVVSLRHAVSIRGG